jgi:opacity protein-like surface antigen
MLRKMTWLVAIAGMVLTAPLAAQDKRVEASFLVGWTFSDGVSTDDSVPIFGEDGQPYNRVDPKDSFKWGFTAGFLATPNVEVGFQYGQQGSKLEASGEVFGTPTRELGDMKVTTYHGYFNYNFLEEDSPIRPYAMFGMGATNFGSVDLNTAAFGQVSTASETQFSTTWGAGVKFFPNPSFGIRAGVQWTPTYIKTDSEGWWCSPYYWGACWVVGDAQYSNQWDLGGGVIFRF